MNRAANTIATTAMVGGALLASQLAYAASVQVYSNDFEGPPVLAAGVTASTTGAGGTESSQGYSAFGFGSNFYRNDSAGNPAASTSFALSGLPSHTSLSVAFLLAVIDSWDGFAANGCAPDIFTVKLDGNTVFSTDFGNVRNGACGSHAQTYGTSNALLFPGAGNIDFDGSSTSVGFSGWNDAAYNMGLESLFQNIAHSASTANFEVFAGGDANNGFQGGVDESWAVDNIVITLNGVRQGNDVPEPGSLALVGLAVATLAALRRRKGY